LRKQVADWAVQKTSLTHIFGGIMYFTKGFLFVVIMAVCVSGQELSQFEQKKNISVQIYEGHIDSALAALDTLIAADSTDASLFFLKGTAFLQLGDNNSALSAYRHTVDLDSTHVNALAAAARLYDQAGYSDHAVYLFERAVKLDSMRFDIANQLGQLYYKSKQYKNSYERYKLLAAKNSENASYLIMLGKCEAKLNNPVGALGFLKKAHTLDSTNVSCLYNISRLYYRIKEPDSALVFVDRGLRLNGKHVLLHLLKGNIMYDKKEWETAVTEFQAYEALSVEDNTVVMKKMGFAYFRLENYIGALGQFGRAIRIEPNDPVSHFYVGLCLKQIDRLGPAAMMIKKAAKLSIPESLPTYYAELGDCYHKIEKYGDAIAAYRRALLYDPGENNHIYALANVYYDYYEDRTVALRCYEKVVEKNSNFEIVAFAKAKVKELKEEGHLRQQ
jgi:tetratricopeptide (TPR) repeat protein